MTGRPSVLIHACCAPCIGHVYELFVDTCEVSLYFFNPNIAPKAEYEKRLAEIERYTRAVGATLIAGPYHARAWTLRVRPYRFLGERSRRCRECISVRLEGAFREAASRGIEAVTSTLSVSPHKDAAMINAIGSELASGFGIRFIEGDYKKRDGYRHSIAVSRAHGFYRQSYCGCVWSRLERARDPLWQRAVFQSTQTTAP